MEKSDLKVIDAFEFAYTKHKGMKRKTSDVAYIVHPMSVAVILMKNLASENLIVAGLLHDVVEDAQVTLTEIEKKFGKEVTKLVNAVSEPKELRTTQSDPKVTWKQRKKHTLTVLSNAGKDIKLLSCADKLSNIRDLIDDHNRLGEVVWSKFNAPKEKQEWYYRSICQAFAAGGEDISELPVFHEFKDCVEQLFKKKA